MIKFEMKKLNMQKFKWIYALSTTLFAFGFSSLIYAAPGDALPLEDVPPPPKVKSGEPLDEPEITIRKKGKDTVEEYRIHGELYMMKVTPEHGVPYYLHKEDQGSDWVNVGPTQPLAVPKWVLFRF